MFHGHLDYFHQPPLGSRPNTKLDDHGTPNAQNRRFILFYHVWEPTWIEIHWNNIWLGVRSHMTPHYTRASMTTLHDFGGVLRWPLHTSFGFSLTISWSRLLACVCEEVALSFTLLPSLKVGVPKTAQISDWHVHWGVIKGGSILDDVQSI